MSDLISREAAIKMICEGGYMAAALAKVEALPTIDAEPVRRGKWYWQEEATYNPTEPTEYNSYWACSACGEDIADYLNHALPSCFIFLDSPDYEPTMEYCPHCGAKMDLEDAK